MCGKFITEGRRRAITLALKAYRRLTIHEHSAQQPWARRGI